MAATDSVYMFLSLRPIAATNQIRRFPVMNPTITVHDARDWRWRARSGTRAAAGNPAPDHHNDLRCWMKKNGRPDRAKEARTHAANSCASSREPNFAGKHFFIGFLICFTTHGCRADVKVRDLYASCPRRHWKHRGGWIQIDGARRRPREKSSPVVSTSR